MKTTNKPLKIIIVIFILELIVVGSIGIFFFIIIQNINNQIKIGQIKDVPQV